MILSDDEIQERIESPLNLLNRLRSTVQRHTNPAIPSLPPTADKLIEDLDDKLKEKSVRSKANSILLKTMTELETRIPDVQKPETLSRIAYDMGRVIATQDVSKGNGSTNVGQIVVYAPQVVNLDSFDIIDVVE